jgi:phosphatidylglycerol---prolipoprotein diacylglyceryl transferase
VSTTLASIGWPVLDRVHFGGSFAISPHGVGIAGGFLAGSWWVLREGPKRGMREDHLSSILFWALIGTIVGARFFYVVGHFSEFNSFIDMLKIYNGGISLLGGIAGAVGFAYPIMRRHRYRFLQVMDTAGIGLPFGIFIGRIGDLVIGDHLGKPTDMPWAFAYHGGRLSAFTCANGVCREDLVKGAQDLVITRHGARLFSQTQGLIGSGAGVHQTALYDFLIACALFLFVYLLMASKPRREGVLIMTFAIGYGLGRIGTDFLRVDKRFFGLTGSQWSSVAVVALCVIVLARWARRAGGGRSSDFLADRSMTTEFVPPREPSQGLPGVSGAGTADKGSALEDTPLQKGVAVAFSLVAAALVAVAWLVDSYVPLFFVWAPQLAIPVFLSRSSRARWRGVAAGSRGGAPVVA